jgi:hypothetical protein
MAFQRPTVCPIVDHTAISIIPKLLLIPFADDESLSSRKNGSFVAPTLTNQQQGVSHMSPVFCLTASLWSRSQFNGGLVLDGVNISLIDLQHMVLLFFILIPYLLLGLLKVVELLRGLLKLSVRVPPDGEEWR